MDAVVKLCLTCGPQPSGVRNCRVECLPVYISGKLLAVLTGQLSSTQYLSSINKALFDSSNSNFLLAGNPF